MGFGRFMMSCVFLAVASGAHAGVKIPLSAAVAQCERLSKGYSNSLVGQGGEVPSNDQVAQRYCSCVHAKAGMYPAENKRRTGIWISGTASIGLTYEY